MSDSKKLNLSVQSMTCASCVGRVDRALAALDGLTEVSVNLATETAFFKADSAAQVSAAAASLAELGYPARSSRVTLNISAMSCASCVGRVDKALAAVRGVLDVSVNLASETATVVYLEGAVTPAILISVSKDAGYPAEIAKADAQIGRAERKADEANAQARRMMFAAVLTIPVFVLEMGSHLVPGIHMLIERTLGLQTSWLIQFVLT